MAIRIIENNKDIVLDALDEAVERALMAVGNNAANYARNNAPTETGRLKNSITHVMEGDNTVIIGTNVEYAPYVELGTGIHATNGNGRKTPWSYKDEEGNWHRTSGQVAHPYLRPAINDHMDEYKRIVENELRNG